MFKRTFSLPPNFKQSFFLFGPRGTGKTTWLKTHFPQASYIDLLEPRTFRTLLAYPEELVNLINPNHRWVIIDEVQKAPLLLSEVHRLLETASYRFILTGSSARTLRRAGVDLLAGRALTYYLYPLTTEELGLMFNLKHSLRYGHLPLAYTSPEPKKFLESYINTYLKVEVEQESLVRNIGGFARFMEIATFSQGSLLNLSEVAREAQLKRKTVANYFEILEDLLIASRLPVFNKHAKRKLLTKNKFYYFDVGVFRSLRPVGPLDSETELDGPALETLVLQELKAVNDYYNLEYKIYFWRSLSGLEVDFVLYGPRGLVAIEVKRKPSIQPSDLRGLNAFGQDYPQAKLLVFSGVKQKEYHGDVEVWPVEEALKNLPTIMSCSAK